MGGNGVARVQPAAPRPEEATVVRPWLRWLLKPAALEGLIDAASTLAGSPMQPSDEWTCRAASEHRVCLLIVVS